MLNITVDTGRRNFVKYDENLFEVYVLDYGDNYHRDENAPTTEFEQEVRKIKARYRDITKYNAAVALYAEYMEYLKEKYGGPELFKAKKKAGLIDDYIPPKPRIKNTKELKFLKKNKIIISATGRFLVDDDRLDDIIDFYSEDIDISKIRVEQGKDKVAEKILDDGSNNKVRNAKSQSFKDDFDFLDNFFRNKNINKSKKKKGKKKQEKILISDLMREDYDDYFYGKDDYDDNKDLGYSIYNDMLLSNGAAKDLDVYHTLNDVGWNSYKLMKKGDFSNRVTNMFKPPKKKKKKKNKSKYNDQYDGLLIDIMTDNGFDTDDMDSFEDFQREMLNMTSENVFR